MSQNAPDVPNAARSARLKYLMILMKVSVHAKRYTFLSRRLYLFAPFLIWRTASHARLAQKRVRVKRFTMICSLPILMLMLELSWELLALRPMTLNRDTISG